MNHRHFLARFALAHAVDANRAAPHELAPQLLAYARQCLEGPTLEAVEEGIELAKEATGGVGSRMCAQEALPEFHALRCAVHAMFAAQYVVEGWEPVMLALSYEPEICTPEEREAMKSGEQAHEVQECLFELSELRKLKGSPISTGMVLMKLSLVATGQDL